MTVIRKFRIASALARIAHRGRQGESHAEGFFPESEKRSSMVHVAGERCVATHESQDGVENYDIALGHGRALLELCASEGRVLFYERIAVDHPGATAYLERVLKPFPIDFVSFEFKDAEAAMAFRVPPYVGQEVSGAPEYENRSMASARSAPAPGPADVSNDALNAFLDLMEGRLPRGESDRPRHGAPRLTVLENTSSADAGTEAIEQALGLKPQEQQATA